MTSHNQCKLELFIRVACMGRQVLCFGLFFLRISEVSSLMPQIIEKTIKFLTIVVCSVQTMESMNRLCVKNIYFSRKMIFEAHFGYGNQIYNR